VGIWDDLHRKIAEECLGLPSPQAIISACGARVERALPRRDLRPEPRIRAHDPASLSTKPIQTAFSFRPTPRLPRSDAEREIGPRARRQNVRGLVGRVPLGSSQRSSGRRAVAHVRRQCRAVHAVAVIKRALRDSLIHAATTTRASGTPASAGSARRSHRISGITRTISAATRTGRIAARVTAAVKQAAAAATGSCEERERDEEERETFHF
jgi:hypothetical protein